MKNLNFQSVLDKTLDEIKKSNSKPTLLLHACCAPCASYVLEYLSTYFDITVYFYNPNISPKEEYEYRVSELYRLVVQMPLHGNVKIAAEEYNSDDFYNISCGLEDLPEGGERCRRCYKMRLEQTAKYAAAAGFDYFCTTLSISPYKNSLWLNEIGVELEKEYGVKYLLSDFKKKNGYKRSCELSNEYGLYRQNYCGCEFSKAEAQKRITKNDTK